MFDCRIPVAVCTCILMVGLIGLATVPSAHAQPSESEHLAAVLRTKVEAPQSAYRPDQPLRLRFLIVNTSADPVTIPLEEAFSQRHGIALPVTFVMGTEEAGHLTLVHADGYPEPIPGVTDDMDETENRRGQRRLKLAAHGALGTEIDLRAYSDRVRYPGDYRIEWQPFGPEYAPAVAEFRVAARQEAIVVTDYGKITFKLYYEQAPLNVANFIELADEDFYAGKTLHRVVPGFVAQGGCPQGTGTGIHPDGRQIPAEFHDAPVRLGTLAMARKPNDPDSASCQFFIALARLEELEGKYTVIGQATDPESYRTLHKLAAVETDDRFRPAEPLYIRSVNLVQPDTSRVRRLSLPERSEPAGARPTPRTR